MGSADKFSLQWNEFQNNVKTTFKSIRKTEEYSDVTLACEDGQQIEAHRVVLASSCMFFRDLLKKNPHSHPLVFMRGIKYLDLSAIIDFIYHGEAEVKKEDLENFLEVAGELSVQGMTKQKDKKVQQKENVVEPSYSCDLCGKYCGTEVSLRTHKYQEHNNKTQQGDSENEDSRSSYDCDTCGKSYGSKGSLRNHKYEHKRETRLKDVEAESKGEFVETIEKFEVHRPQTIINADDSINSLDESLGNDMDNYEKKIDDLTENREGVWTCIQCGKNDKLKFMIRRHAEIHIGGFTFTCNKCEKNFPHRNALKAHVLRAHPEERTIKPYNCDSCDSSHKNARGLKEHKYRNHKGDASCEVEAGEGGGTSDFD